MNVIFGSVIYPNAVKYAVDFLKSLNIQTDKNYTLILINDGVPPQILDCIMAEYENDYEILNYSEKLSPVALRIKLMEETYLRGGDFLILGDIDDYFSKNRIEKVKNAFFHNEGIGFVYNDLLLTNGERCMPKMPDQVNSERDILEYNFLGLSNTAINIKNIDRKFIISLTEYQSYVFDWYLFSRLAMIGKRGIYIPEGVTYYRIHEENYAGVPKKTAKMIGKEVYVKRMHYDALSKYKRCYRMLYETYKNNNYMINNKERYFWWDLTRRKENEI